MKTYVNLYYLTQFFLEREILQEKSCRENPNTHFMFKMFSPPPPNITPFMR